MSEKQKAIKAIELLIKQADRRFEKAKGYPIYEEMATVDGYRSGLQEALEVVKLMQEAT